MIQLEVVYALPDKQTVKSLAVPEGLTVLAVIELSGVLSEYPEIDLAQQSVGIFGQTVSLETTVEPNDRIEIYRPLVLDPMEARRLRALKQKKPRRAHQKRPSNGALQQAHDSFSDNTHNPSGAV